MDGEGLLAGFGKGIEAGIKGYMDADDRLYRRKEAEAKRKALETEAERKIDQEDAQLGMKGYRAQRDPKTRRIMRDEQGQVMLNYDPSLAPPLDPYRQAQINLVNMQTQELEKKGIINQNKLISEGAAKGFKVTFDDAGQAVYTPTPEKMQSDLLKIEELRAKISKLKGGGKGGAGGGKQLSQQTAMKFGEARSAVDAISQVENIIDVNKDMFNPDKSFLNKVKTGIQSAQGTLGAGDMGERVTKVDAALKAQAQLIGRYLEGGILKREDEIKYEAMLPKRGDTMGTALSKRDNIMRLISTKMEREAQALEGSGYNTSGVRGLINVQPQGLINKKTAPKAAGGAGKAAIKAGGANPAALQYIKLNENSPNPAVRAKVERIKKALQSSGGM